MKLHAKAKVKGKIEITDKKVITGKFRLSYPALFEPKEYNGKKSWSISMLFSKDQDLSPLEIAAHNAAVEKWGSDVSKWPSQKVRSKKTGKIIEKCIVKMPFRDGDMEKPDKEEYENMIFVGASCKKNAPGVIDQRKKPIEDASGIKAGDYARASLIAFAYDQDGSFGVSFTLLNVQKLATGDSLGGGRSAAEEFDEVEYDEEEDADDMEDESEESDDEESEDEDEESDDEEEEEEPAPKKKTSKKTSKR